MGDSQTLQRVKAKVTELGFPIPEKPSSDVGDLSWPSNVGDLTPDQLGEHMTWWTGWASYARIHLAEAETNSAAFKKEYDYYFKRHLHANRAEYSKVTELKAFVSLNPELQKKEAALLETEALAEMVQALLSGYEEKRATVSREISRRGMDWAENNPRKDHFRS